MKCSKVSGALYLLLSIHPCIHPSTHLQHHAVVTTVLHLSQTTLLDCIKGCTTVRETIWQNICPISALGIILLGLSSKTKYCQRWPQFVGRIQAKGSISPVLVRARDRGGSCCENSLNIPCLCQSLKWSLLGEFRQYGLNISGLCQIHLLLQFSQSSGKVQLCNPLLGKSVKYN